ncbi:MAG: type II toxin-antitoxin system death-on-curing family toxin [Ferruginibacter sp.]
MILLDDVLNLHDASIEDFGGAKGVRDMALLESALARPFQTFAGEDLYPTAIEKAAAIGESLIINHPFIDGNKRTGLLAVATLLLEYNIIINASENELFQFVIEISTGEIKFEQIVEWFKVNTSSR